MSNWKMGSNVLFMCASDSDIKVYSCEHALSIFATFLRRAIDDLFYGKSSLIQLSYRSRGLYTTFDLEAAGLI